MTPRLLIGPVLIGLLVGLMWLDWYIARVRMPAGLRWMTDPDGTGWAGVPLMIAGVLLCARAAVELARMFRALGVNASTKGLMFCAIVGLVSAVLSIGSLAPMAGPESGSVVATGAGVALFVTMAAYVRDRDLKGAGGAVAAALVSFTYAGLLLGFLMAIRREYEVWVMVAVVMTIKACDIGAYFTGKAVGRHKLIPWLSPGKTWEGLAGGVALSALCGVAIAWLGQNWDGLERVQPFRWYQGMALGALLAVMGQLGDLAASVFKRDAGLKDSGRMLPGFGGMIDLLDSLILAGPVAYWFLWLLQRGG
jgi:phosphatidate cytidylyltransferase